MSRLWPEGEVISVQCSGEQQPVSFVWRGRMHRLAQVQQRWQVDADWWSTEGRVRRDYWAVTTASGLFCVFYQDLERGSWFLAKVYD